tara:strand:- start:8413 stop:8847 length:435 start_codon:yes stop_codon:yes gene_type:complete
MDYPPHLIEAFKKLTNDFETAIRADERQRLLVKFRAEFADKPVTKPEPLYPITGMHGEPLHEIGAKPLDSMRVHLNRTHKHLISLLSEGTFYAVPTLAGHLNVQKSSIYAYLDVLKKCGYDLEIRSTGNLKGGYRNIYRLAKAA